MYVNKVNFKIPVHKKTWKNKVIRFVQSILRIPLKLEQKLYDYIEYEEF